VRLWQRLLGFSRSGRGRAVGPLRVWLWWERLTTWWWRLRPVRPGGLLLYSVQVWKGPPVRLADGTEVRPGDRVAELHLHNALFPRRATDSPWPHLATLRQDLDCLRDLLARDRLVAAHGVTVFGEAARRLGFEVRPLPPSAWWRLVRFFLWGLRAVYHPTARGHRPPPWPVEVWWRPENTVPGRVTKGGGTPAAARWRGLAADPILQAERRRGGMHRVLILGGGSGGAIAAKRLAEWSRPGEVEVVLVDRSPWHEYRPSYLWVMTGKRQPEEVRRPLKLLEARYGTRVVQAAVTRIDPVARRVDTEAGGFDYDFLVVALGAVLHPDPRTEGHEGPWELEHALRLRERLREFRGGHVVVGPVEWPYRCPPAPFEVAFMLRYLADQRHVSDRTRITVFHPWQQPMETFGPLMVEGFRAFLRQFQVDFEGGFQLGAHDRDRRVLRSTDGRVLEYDLAVLIPPHAPPEPVRNSPLAAAGGYMDVTLPSMASPRYPEVYGIGDVVAPTIGLGMAGVFAHFQADHVATQILDRVRGVYLGELYNMVGVCVMDTGYMGAAVWCDFTDKLYGRSPYPDCRLLGGMRLFRSVKVGFERLWFASLFGR